MPPCDADPAARTGPEALPPGPPQRATAKGDIEAVPLSLVFTLPAELAAAWLARARLRSWLDGLRWPGELVDDIEYAVSEAVSNAAEHAYGPDVPEKSVEVDAHVEQLPDGSRRLRIHVRDAGRWRPANPDSDYRGRGLFMMNRLMEEVTIRRGDGSDGVGTEVVMLSPVAPPPSAPVDRSV